MSAPAPDDRAAFAERLRLQVRARYRGADVAIDAERFVLTVRAEGIDTTLPLAPLHHACVRDPARAPDLIARYVSSLERRLTPRTGAEFSTARLLWCVRSRASVAEHARAAALLSMDVAADLVAFVAEELPGSIMRGVPREEWELAGLDDDSVRAAATAQTAARFAPLTARITRLERVPADGWRMAGDPLFQSSALVVPELLRALVSRSQRDVLIAAPDRGVVLAVPSSDAATERFRRRVLREWREAMNPCSRAVLVADGGTLRELPKRQRASGVVLPWLAE